VKALTDSKLLKVNRQDFLQLYRSNHKFANNLTNIIIGYLNHSNNMSRYIMFSSRDAVCRISFMYDFLAGKYGVVQNDGSCEIHLPFNSQLILEFLGMHQQAYSRNKKILTDNGVIYGHGRKIVINNYAQFCQSLHG